MKTSQSLRVGQRVRVSCPGCPEHGQAGQIIEVDGEAYHVRLDAVDLPPICCYAGELVALPSWEASASWRDSSAVRRFLLQLSAGPSPSREGQAQA